MVRHDDEMACGNEWDPQLVTANRDIGERGQLGDKSSGSEVRKCHAKSCCNFVTKLLRGDDVSFTEFADA